MGVWEYGNALPTVALAKAGTETSLSYNQLGKLIVIIDNKKTTFEKDLSSNHNKHISFLL